MYGVLRDATNTGSNDELITKFAAPLNIISNVSGYASDTINLKRFASASDAQRWELEARIIPQDSGTEWFINNVVNAFYRTMFIRMPQLYIQNHGANGLSAKTPVGAPIDDPLPTLTLTNGYPAGTTTLSITGIGSYELMAGEFVRFSGDSKVYVITSAGSTGLGFTIFPALRKAKNIGDVMTYGDSVTMDCLYSLDNTFGVIYSDGILADPGVVTFIEKLA